MKRGSVVVFREQASPAAKSRPCVVVQRDVTLPGAAKITAVPLTTVLSGGDMRRPLLMPSLTNGLVHPCEAQIDWIFSFEVARLGRHIGETEAEAMEQIDSALRIWLNL